MEDKIGEMVILNVYGEINPIIISKKLGLGISNLEDDWILGLQDDISEEVLIREHDLSVWNNIGINSRGVTKYNLSQLVYKAKWEDRLDTEEELNKEIIAKKLIGIDVCEFENSFLKLKNQVMDSPTCEPEYPHKFIKFCCKIQNAKSAKEVLNNRIPFAIYSSNDLDKKTRVLNYLQATLKFTDDIKKYKDECINALIKIGSIIDNFIKTEEDFWKFDYILNSLYYDEGYNSYYIFKIMSLIGNLLQKKMKC